jgi:hypothetical protein
MSRVALVVVTLGGMSVTLGAIPVDQPGVGAGRWAHSLGRAERAAYLQDSTLRSLPLEYRVALLNSVVKGAARAAFWRTAFAAYRASHALTPQQVLALNRALALATPEALDGSTRSIPLWKTVIDGLQVAFGPAGTNDILYRSGTAIGSGRLPSGERLYYEWRRLTAHVTAMTGFSARALQPDCNCYSNNDCFIQFACNTSVACNADYNGCLGPGGMCVGICGNPGH